MRKFLQQLLTKPVINLANKWSSRPDRRHVDRALTALHEDIQKQPGKLGPVIEFDAKKDKFIILSDQHKGARDGADIFAKAEGNYLAALDHYNEQKFFYINIGDSEELWENLIITIKRHNKKTFEKEKHFLKRKAFIKIFGNHDLYWDNDPLAQVNLIDIYGEAVKIYEGVILKTRLKDKPFEIYMTHGHQGDLQSDGNWFSKWFVSDIWAPFQAYLQINPNTPSTNDTLKTLHNEIMYQWSSKRKNRVLITGHTHQPVFRSLTELEILYEKLDKAKAENKTNDVAAIDRQINELHLKSKKQPSFKGILDTYFNSGCCCFDDGDITGIEIEDECIRLIKWQYNGKKASERVVLEESRLDELKLA
jgi:predicted phosphodiesterase